MLLLNMLYPQKLKASGLFCIFIGILCCTLIVACTRHPQNSSAAADVKTELADLYRLLKEPDTTGGQQHFALLNLIAQKLGERHQEKELAVLLTDRVESNPDDPYNAYWLLLTAYTYNTLNQIPVSAYYYQRILNNYPDLLIQDISIHKTCIENLLPLTTDSRKKISLYSTLLSRFSDQIDTAATYFRLAQIHEKTGEWELAIQTYTTFLNCPDAVDTQIPGIADAYGYAKKQVDFNNSPKDWTFETLDDLVSEVKQGLRTNNARQLEKYRAKVNFFARSWNQSTLDKRDEADFSIGAFMGGRRIRFADELDTTSNSSEAYLRTWGWDRIPVWYFYFRKVDFPADPEIHGRWEWAGIYDGEKI